MNTFSIWNFKARNFGENFGENFGRNAGRNAGENAGENLDVITEESGHDSTGSSHKHWKIA